MRLLQYQILFATTLVLGLVSTGSVEAAITNIDMTTANTTNTNTTSFGGGLDFGFSTVKVGSSGTGTIDSFVRLQATGSEQGYNGNNPGEFDEKGGQANRPVLIDEVQTGFLINEGGMNDEFGEFVLDSTDGGLLSLNQIQIFAATTSFATSNTLTSNGITTTANGTPIIAFDPTQTVEIFRLSDEVERFNVLIDSSLGNGSGTFDLRFFFDLDIASSLGAEYTHFILYSQFGDPPGTDPSGAGFEEWAIALGEKSAFVPEPSTWALMLITACGAIFLQFRARMRQRTLMVADSSN